jgi:hypothetical protein
MDLRHKVKKQIIKANDLNFQNLNFNSKTKNPPTVLLSIAIYSIMQVGSYASQHEDPTWDSFHPYQREIGAGTSTYTDTKFFFFF